MRPAKKNGPGLAVLWLALWSATLLAADDPAKLVSDIRDNAGMFSAGAIAKALPRLEAIERETGVPTVIETIETLEGASIDEATLRRARKAIDKGIYILLAKRESKIEVAASPDLKAALPLPKRLVIASAFVDKFREKKIDEGLEQGVKELGMILGNLNVQGRIVITATAASPPTSTHDAGSSSLVLRNQYRLTLAGARKVVAGCEEKAAQMKLKMNIAVVDDGGHMLAFARMDGARPASGYTATTKAITAATFRQATGPLPPGSATPDVLLNVSLQNAAAASGGKVTTLLGGVPVVVEGQVIGGVGIGGGSGEQDAEVARAGIAAFLKDLQATPANEGKKPEER